eukprot:TRINITY_DN1862_c0_g1_i2.p1 TRINITY_DN1862_c0_g1~~TRINITY_DN1862_c0_g1_i2.p1  ORF type:complete len:240 (+),score=77.36 TRINITY_DN1862_c0_g1_i2:203-922(+)
MGAPQVTIETITVTRPLKVIAFTCCVVTVILTVTATATADWILAEGWREGLFTQCISEGAPKPLPFDMEPVPGCGKARSAGYLKGCAALCVIGVLTDFFGTMLTCFGLKSTDPNKKYKYYRVSIYALIIAAFAFLLAVIIYPVQFAKDLEDDDADLDDDGDGVPDSEDNDDDNDGVADDDELEGSARTYTFGFGYGAVWGSIILLFASIVLLICDRESEEIFYKEKQVEEEEEEETGEA